MSEILPPHASAILLAGETLREGKLVGIPTETVYGLAANAFDPDAVAAVFKAKGRPTFDPLIVHVSPALLRHASRPDSVTSLAALGIIDLEALSPSAQEVTRKLIEKYWPGPLTVVLPRGEKIPDLVTSGLAFVGVRMPAHVLAQGIIDAAGVPLAAPSANRFGRISPTNAHAVLTELGDGVELIIDGGTCSVGVESTVVGVNPITGACTLYRPGGISKESIETLLGTTLARSAPIGTGPQVAPGQVASHYAPEKTFILLPHALDEVSVSDLSPLSDAIAHGRPHHLGVLIMEENKDAALPKIESFKKILAEVLGARVPSIRPPGYEFFALSSKDTDTAKHLFARLREMDACTAELLVAEPFPSTEGLGLAIQDRLTRASTLTKPDSDPNP